MKNELTPLSPNSHRQHGWAGLSDFRFAAADTVTPLLLAELPSAAGVFPLAFVKLPDGLLHLVGVMGLLPRQNLLVDRQGRWLGAYIPASYRAFPFSLQRVSDDKQRLALCFNESSGLMRATPDPARGETRFFDDEGKPVPQLQKALDFLQTCVGNAPLTQAAVRALDAVGVLQPWPEFKGLYRIDEPAFGQLNAEQLLALRDAYALPLAYAQLLSLPRMAALQRLLAERQQAERQAAAKPDLGLAQQLYDADASDTIKFNW